jgi:hypothetical protein
MAEIVSADFLYPAYAIKDQGPGKAGVEDPSEERFDLRLARLEIQ